MPVPRAHADETAAAPIRLVVDLNRCEAYAQCCFLAPSIFELHGEEALLYDPEPSNAERDRVLRAAASCPVQAIRVEVEAESDPREAQSTLPDVRSRR